MGFLDRLIGVEGRTFTPRGLDVYLSARASRPKPGETDEDLCALLEAASRGNHAAYAEALAALEDSGEGGDHYRLDRARRVLTHLVSGEPISPPAADRARLFQNEQRLRDLATDQAFDEILGKVPALRDLLVELDAEIAAKPPPRADWRRTAYLLAIATRVREIVGPDGGSPDPLMRSPVTSQIAIWGIRARLGIPR